MTLHAHGSFNVDEAESAIVWRYVGLSALLHLLAKKTLYFPLLASLEDPWEGSPGMPDLLAFAEGSGLEGNERLEAVQTFQKRFARRRSRLAASCWYRSERESAAMWTPYAERGRGIAIRSTVGRLAAALDEGRELTIGAVEYVDHLTTTLGEEDLRCAFAKNAAYAHENEVRVVTSVSDDEWSAMKDRKGVAGPRWYFVEGAGDGPNIAQVSVQAFGDGPTDGVYVVADTSSLIDRVVVAPGAEPWVVEAVQASVSALEHDLPVVRSSLGTVPLHRPVRGRLLIFPGETKQGDDVP